MTDHNLQSRTFHAVWDKCGRIEVLYFNGGVFDRGLVQESGAHLEIQELEGVCHGLIDVTTQESLIILSRSQSAAGA